MKTLLHPSDFSPASRPAFKKAIELAKKDRATLELLHVLTPIIRIAATESAKKTMAGLLQQARTAGVMAKSIVVVGTPADVIVRAARTRRADLIVTGTHSRSGLSRFLLGSVASRVIATSLCPVLTVRGK